MNGSAQVKPAEEAPEPHDPRKATILSAVLPGAGQIYNGKWWKAPIVYGGLAVSVYAIIENSARYNTYKEAIVLRTDDDPNTVDDFDPDSPNTPINERYTVDNLKTLLDYYQRNRDLSYVAVVAVYLLQIIDANVDGHLYNFDVSDDLSMRLEPSLFNFQPMTPSYPGVKVKFSF